MSIGDPLIDIAAIKRLAENPERMATMLLQLEKRAKEWKIGTEPQRRASLITQLKHAVEESVHDSEAGHQAADDLLLEFINDEEISNLYGQVRKYYAD
jgi:uncharacterized protein YpuA (DUF1002 family)